MGLWKRITQWLRRLKEDLERESVSRSTERPHCCSEPPKVVETGPQKGRKTA